LEGEDNGEWGEVESSVSGGVSISKTSKYFTRTFLAFHIYKVDFSQVISYLLQGKSLLVQHALLSFITCSTIYLCTLWQSMLSAVLKMILANMHITLFSDLYNNK
jgi:hypothetical protein